MEVTRAIVSARHRLPLGFVVRASLVHLWLRLRWFVVAVFLAGAVFVFAGLQTGRTNYAIVGAVLALYAIFSLPLTALRGAVKRARFSRIERIVRLGEDGIETIGVSNEPTTFSWESFDHARRARDFWLLYLKNGLFLVVPDFAFDPADLPGLTAVVRERVG